MPRTGAILTKGVKAYAAEQFDEVDFAARVYKRIQGFGEYSFLESHAA